MARMLPAKDQSGVIAAKNRPKIGAFSKDQAIAAIETKKGTSSEPSDLLVG